jgi:putative ABC transport system substrate-binding protein
MAAIKATRTIPIVMASSADPVRSGMVASLARPGGNVTGFTILGPELEGKRMQLLKRAVPKLARVAVLWNPSNPGIRHYFEAIEAAARTMHVIVGPVTEVRRDEELEAAFAAIAKVRPDALAVIADRALLANRRRIVDFAAARRLPAMYPYGEYVDAGGLMSYAPSNAALFRGAASYVDRIIRGAQPATMPVQEPTTFELVINVKTAKALGLTLPEALLLEADRLVE